MKVCHSQQHGWTWRELCQVKVFPGGNLPAVQEIQVLISGREDPLEKGMVTHSSIPA